MTNYTYNAANQLTSGGATYDNNGNMTSDGTNSYTWDRANRLVRWDDGVPAHLIQHAYDGLGNRTRGSLAGGWVNGWHQYLLDLQSGLTTVLGDDLQGIVSGGFTGRTYFNHGRHGIQAQNRIDGLTGERYWQWTVQDGLGSVREVVDNSVGILESRNYDPYGNGFGATGSSQTGFGFTGELVDGSGLLYLRARYYRPTAGVFASRDPFEGVAARPMSLNGYSWVEGNVPNEIDPSGKCIDISVCKDLRAKSQKAAIAAGCSSQLGECCGPDASKWLFTEFASHNSYAEGAFLQDLQDQYNNAASGIFSGFASIVDLAPEALKRLMGYGLAVDYSNIDYRELEIESRQSSGCSDAIVPRYTCPDSRESTISVCGNCQNASNYGNFIFGIALYASSQTPFMAGAAGIIFNTRQAFGDVGGGIEGIIEILKRLPDMYSDADTQGVLAGYDFASKNQSILTTSYNREAFCQAMNSLGGAWQEPLDQPDFSTCGLYPCNEDGPNLNYAAHIPPNWNVYSSSRTNPEIKGNSAEELKAKFGI